MEEVDDWTNRQTSVAKTEDTVSFVRHVSLERELKPPVFLVSPSEGNGFQRLNTILI